MFIYNASLNLSLRAYGIMVPMLDQRVEIIKSWVQKKIDIGHFSPEVLINEDHFPASEELLRLAHDPEFVRECLNNPAAQLLKTFELVDKDGNYHRYRPEIAALELPRLMTTVRKQVSASARAAEIAFEKGFAFFLGGGLHHAMSSAGRGFCQFNDIVVAARSLLKKTSASNIWIIDLDAHKGDGTAQILRDDNSISTFSIHMGAGWPLDSERTDSFGNPHPWFIDSDVDVPVFEGEEKEYMNKLREGMRLMQDKFPPPDFAIVVAGSDPYKKDGLASSSFLKLELDQMLERDMFVYDFFKSKDIPQLYLMSGGYGEFAHEPYIQFLDHILG